MPAIINGVDQWDESAGIPSWPDAAAADDGVSVAQALRWLSEFQVGMLQNTTGVPTLAGILGDVANSPVADRLTALQNHVGPSASSSRYLAVTADFTNAQWNTATTHEVFTVTGTVRMRLWVTCGANVASAGDSATISFGIAGTTTAFIAATAEDALDAGDLWYDDSPTVTYDTFGNSVMDYVVANGTDVGYEVANEALTEGNLTFHCVWEPLSATGAVAAGAGGVL